MDGSIKFWPPTGTNPSVSLDVTKFTTLQGGGDKSDIVSISKPSASSGSGSGSGTTAASAVTVVGMKKDQTAGLASNNEMLGKSGKVINMWVDHMCERY